MGLERTYEELKPGIFADAQRQALGGMQPAVAGNEADADAIAQAVYRAIMDAFRIIRASSPKPDSEDIVLKLDSKELARVTLPALTREAQRRGYNLVLRGV
jgi:hypothetical protein